MVWIESSPSSNAPAMGRGDLERRAQAKRWSLLNTSCWRMLRSPCHCLTPFRFKYGLFCLWWCFLSYISSPRLSILFWSWISFLLQYLCNSSISTVLQEQLQTRPDCSPQWPWHNAFIGLCHPGIMLRDWWQIPSRHDGLQSPRLLQLPNFIKGEEESKVWRDPMKSLRTASLEILTWNPHKALALHQVLQYLAFLFAVGAWVGIGNYRIKSIEKTPSVRWGKTPSQLYKWLCVSWSCLKLGIGQLGSC